MRPKKWVLLLSTNELQSSILRLVMEVRGFAVATAITLPEALAWLEQHRADAIVLDGYSERVIEELNLMCRELKVLWLMPRGAQIESTMARISVPYGKLYIAAFLDQLATICVKRRGPKPLHKVLRLVEETSHA